MLFPFSLDVLLRGRRGAAPLEILWIIESIGSGTLINVV